MAHSISDLDDLADDSGRAVDKADGRIESAVSSGWIGSSKRAMEMAREQLVTDGRQITGRVKSHVEAFTFAARAYADQESSNSAVLSSLGTRPDDGPTLLNL